MKSKLLIAASLFGALSGQAGAATLTEASYFDAEAFVYEFGAKQITALDAASSFSFVLNAADFGFNTLAGSYFVLGDISGSNFKLNSVSINGTPWNPSSGGSNIDLGSLSFPAVSQVQVEVSGDRLGAGANFQGSLILTPVPEPETYALLLAGLAAVGFMARRRSSI
ncbi:FxDxF family PEP-CTERM protein [Roseateles sp.]|uniref:FxDxF family PEP-CTERM protein n=1 Tax=Roseateles sp. TaxID=1971397 RepID=UPI003BA6FC1A